MSIHSTLNGSECHRAQMYMNQWENYYEEQKIMVKIHLATKTHAKKLLHGESRHTEFDMGQQRHEEKKSTEQSLGNSERR